MDKTKYILMKKFRKTMKETRKRGRMNSKIYDSELYAPNSNHTDEIYENNIVVLSDDCLTPIRQGEKKYCLLNFANPVNPGGGVTIGAMAQEEGICRNSTLYASLTTKTSREYYHINIAENAKQNNDIFTSWCIYSPYVEIVPDVETNINFSVITSAAPIRSSKNKRTKDEEMKHIFEERIYTILNCAKDHDEKNLILGAYGCGAFRNDPDIVAHVFKEALSHYEFKSVLFAILPTATVGISNLVTFKNVFS